MKADPALGAGKEEQEMGDLGGERKGKRLMEEEGREGVKMGDMERPRKGVVVWSWARRKREERRQ